MYVCVCVCAAVEKKLTRKNVSSPACPTDSFDSQLAVSIRNGVASGILQSVLHWHSPYIRRTFLPPSRFKKKNKKIKKHVKNGHKNK
jgi:hypothetical protein